MQNRGPSLDESLSNLSSSAGRTFPSPPGLHWAVLLLAAFAIHAAGDAFYIQTGSPWIRETLSSKTVLFLWLLVQASFVQKLSQRNFVFSTVAAGLVGIVPIMLIRTGQVDAHGGASFLPLVGAVMLWMDLFRMKDCLEHHYNAVEHYRLSMLGIPLYLLGPIYLQYHFRKIALWKKRQASAVIA